MKKIYMKHSGSTASDLMIDYTINDDEKTVTIEVDHFDSSLIQSFLAEVLARDGINTIRDDREEWNPPLPPYRVFMLLAGVRYKLEAHYLVLGGFTVVLKPI